MRSFTTVCDINYLPQGLALYRSLMKHNSSFILYWGCMDDKALDAVISQNLTNVIAYSTQNFETNGMSHKEYAWSLASRFTWWILERYDMDNITYLDADLYFYQDYERIFAEIGNKSIAMVEHRIPSYKTVGRYNVAFNYFKNDKSGRKCLSEWQRLCADKGNEYFKEYGSCGDQKYLELFPQWFPKDVHIIECGHIAWWNSKYVSFTDDSIIYEGKQLLLIFIHYSHFRLVEPTGYTHDEMREMPVILKKYYDDYEQEVRKAKTI